MCGPEAVPNLVGKGEGCHSLRHAPENEKKIVSERIKNGKKGGDKGTVSQDREIFKARIAKKQYRKFETNFPRKGIARGESRFLHSYVCERLIYPQDRSVAGKYVDRFWEYIICSQTDERDFLCSVSD
jgi:hypothetical protein